MSYLLNERDKQKIYFLSQCDEVNRSKVNSTLGIKQTESVHLGEESQYCLWIIISNFQLNTLAGHTS